MDEINVGKRFHYKKDASGFWIAQFETDPQSSTLLQSELISLLQDYVVNARDAIERLSTTTDKIEKQIKVLEDEV